ncbi:MAG: iron complex outermembrane receptor protein, partial [Lysobacterales bacterium]
VSARKRDENIQDIPQSIQAFSQQDIAKIGIKGLDDVAKFAPSMTVVGSSAGLQKIVFRGLADSVRPFIADSSSAIYLDEQPLTTGAQSPEIRPIDLERIEVLAGPQGTLYGASSQSGTVRYITAKPDTSEFDANVGGGMHSVSGGDTGWDADFMVNIPLIKDKFAIRLVGFGAKDAGYIDNVLSNTPGRFDANSGEQILGNKTNAALVEEDFNSADWKGARISAKWNVNEDWSLTGIYNNSDSKINGYSDYDPTQGDLKTIKFKNELWDDNWSNFQLTLDGDLGFGKFTSSTSYFERDTAYQFDGTNGIAYYHSALGFYGRGSCGSNPYYAYYNIYDFATACELNYTGYDTDDADPTATWRNDQRDTRWTHETRFSGSNSRWDWTAGFFYQEAKQEWIYKTTIDDYTKTESWAAFNALYGGLEPTNVKWSSREKNKREDRSLFGEATINISDKWKMLLGGRWYKADVERTYTLRNPGTAPASISKPSGSDSGFLPKIGLQTFPEDDRMFYALYSEGFRTGGINRARGNPTLPVQYNSDLLENYEFGMKSQWKEGKVQLNIIGYHQVWKDMQLELTDPSWAYGEPYQTVIANVGDAVVDGMDIEISVLPAPGWTLGLVSTNLFKAEINENIAVFDARSPGDLALEIPKGTRLPLVADLNLAAFAEYDWVVNKMNGADAYLRLQYSHTGSSYNRLLDNDGDPDGTTYGGRSYQPGYEVWDLRAGLAFENWDISLFADNLTDERQTLFHDTNADLYWGRDNVRTGQPRTYGVNVRHYFK